MLQNLPSLAAALALSPAPGSRVIDMCAAPGGKSTLLAQLMRNQGEVVAADRSHSKVPSRAGGVAAGPS
jgi:16S rRNA C967 or C1407 C5-methylase (RsmB/RsmF family)